METLQPFTEMVRPGVAIAGVLAFVAILIFVVRHLDAWPVWRTGPLTLVGGCCLLAAFKAGVYRDAIWTILAVVCLVCALAIAIASSLAHRKICRSQHMAG